MLHRNSKRNNVGTVRYSDAVVTRCRGMPIATHVDQPTGGAATFKRAETTPNQPRDNWGSRWSTRGFQVLEECGPPRYTAAAPSGVLVLSYSTPLGSKMWSPSGRLFGRRMRCLRRASMSPSSTLACYRLPAAVSKAKRSTVIDEPTLGGEVLHRESARTLPEKIERHV